MPYDTKRLSHVHQAMVDMALSGATRGQIADAMGRTPESVGLIMRSPLFQDELARRREEQRKQIDERAAGTINEAREHLAAQAKVAAEKLTSLMVTSPDQKIQQTSAIEVLRRTYDPRYMQQKEQGQLTLNLQPGALLNLQIALRESRELGGGETLLGETGNFSPSSEPLPQLLDQADQPDPTLQRTQTHLPGSLFASLTEAEAA